jgi:hypothetical protein
MLMKPPARFQHAYPHAPKVEYLADYIADVARDTSL